MRLGYACINMGFSNLPKSKRITTNRGMIKRTFLEKGLPYASELALQKVPMKWQTLAESVGWKGTPPKDLIQHGLLMELEDGMWLHEALKERLLRDVR